MKSLRSIGKKNGAKFDMVYWLIDLLIKDCCTVRVNDKTKKKLSKRKK